MDQLFSWIVTALGLIGFWLAGKKLWWSWYINIVNQVMWVIFALITDYYAFLVGTAFYLVVFCRNAYLWTKEHFDKKTTEPLNKMLQEHEDSVPPDFINLFPCGHISHQWRLACEVRTGHQSLHRAGDKSWTDEQGEYTNQFSGRLVPPKE